MDGHEVRFFFFFDCCFAGQNNFVFFITFLAVGLSCLKLVVHSNVLYVIKMNERFHHFPNKRTIRSPSSVVYGRRKMRAKEEDEERKTVDEQQNDKLWNIAIVIH